MEAHELIHAALEWAKSKGYAQRAQEEQVPLKDAYAEVRRLREETGKTLDAAQSRIEELERERNGILSLNDELANERNALKWQIDDLRKDLDAAKNARIEAEKEAADLRAWRKGLVRPGTEQPERWPVVVDVNPPEDIRLSVGRIGDSERWFDPRDIFEAADRDAEQTDQDSADECD